ncbi:MAG: hypothetical protein M1826_006935 [Phylliscum demangeonii]|nr:MAG: hypothetical protein M1826_006935 [Phylliscum demangeonii]
MPLTVIFEDEDLYSRQPSEKALLVAAVRRHHRGTLLNRVPRIFVKAVVCGAWHTDKDGANHATVDFFGGDNDRKPFTGHVLRGPPRPPQRRALRRDWAPWLLPAGASPPGSDQWAGNSGRGGGVPEASGGAATTKGGAGSGEAAVPTRNPAGHVKAVVCSGGHKGETDAANHAKVEFFAEENDGNPSTAHVLRGPHRPPDPALRRDWAPWLLPAGAVTATTGSVGSPNFVEAVICGAWHQDKDDAANHATVEFYAGDNDENPRTAHVLRGPHRPPDPALGRDWAPWLLPAVAVTATTGPVDGRCIRVTRPLLKEEKKGREESSGPWHVWARCLGEYETSLNGQQVASTARCAFNLGDGEGWSAANPRKPSRWVRPVPRQDLVRYRDPFERRRILIRRF